MQPCECGGRRFEISASCSARVQITIGDMDEGEEEFEVDDVNHGDTEWDEGESVTCLKCGKTMDVDDLDDPEEVEQPDTSAVPAV